MALRIKSAKKRHRQNLRKRVRNRAVKSSLKTKTKDFLAAIEKKDVPAASSILPSLISAFDKAASKGIIHKKVASKKVAVISRKLYLVHPSISASVEKSRSSLSQAD